MSPISLEVLANESPYPSVSTANAYNVVMSSSFFNGLRKLDSACDLSHADFPGSCEAMESSYHSRRCSEGILMTLLVLPQKTIFSLIRITLYTQAVAPREASTFFWLSTPVSLSPLSSGLVTNQACLTVCLSLFLCEIFQIGIAIKVKQLKISCERGTKQKQMSYNGPFHKCTHPEEAFFSRLITYACFAIGL